MSAAPGQAGRAAPMWGSMAGNSGMAGTGNSGTLADRIGNAVLRGLIAALRALPFHLRVGLMGWIMRALIGPLAGYRRRALDNLAMVHPDWPRDHRRAVAGAAEHPCPPV